MTKKQGKSGTIDVKALLAEDEEFLRGAGADGAAGGARSRDDGGLEGPMNLPRLPVP